MKKVVLFILMLMPMAVLGQQKEKSIPENDQMKDWPHAFQMLVLKTISNNCHDYSFKITKYSAYKINNN